MVIAKLMENIKQFIMNNKLYWGIFVLAFILAIIFRVVLPFGYTVTDDGIRYSQVDGYYQLRMADNYLSTGYPPSYDYYVLPFEPHSISNFLFIFPTILYAVSSTGIPVDLVALIINPLLGLISLLLVYLIARKIFDKQIALFSLFIAAIIPGDFLYRTALGYTDQHSLEIVFLLSSLLFLLMSFKKGMGSVIYSAIAGIFAGLYMGLYPGGLIIFGLYVLYGVVSIFISKDKDIILDNIARLVILICVGVIIYMLIGKINQVHVFTIIILVLGLIILAFLKLYLIRNNRSNWIYIVLVPIVGAISCGYVFVAEIRELLYRVSYYILWNPSSTINEEQPLLLLDGKFTLGQIWANWGFLFFIFLIGMGMLLRYYKTGNRQYILFLIVSSAFMTVLTLSERRFAYYLSPLVAIIAVYALISLYRWLRTRIKTVNIYAVVCLVFICFPLFTYSSFINKPLQEYMTDDWHDALVWMKDNTPQPFEKANYYSYLKEDDKPAYLVLSWWDNGYWIIREAQRVPLVHPGSGYWEIASQILTGNKQEAMKMIEQYKIKYIIFDRNMVIKELSHISKYSKGDPYSGLLIEMYIGRSNFEEVYKNDTVRIYEVK